jgi:hypothetical protein
MNAVLDSLAAFEVVCEFLGDCQFDEMGEIVQYDFMS